MKPLKSEIKYEIFEMTSNDIPESERQNDECMFLLVEDVLRNKFLDESIYHCVFDEMIDDVKNQLAFVKV